MQVYVGLCKLPTKPTKTYYKTYKNLQKPTKPLISLLPTKKKLWQI